MIKRDENENEMQYVFLLDASWTSFKSKEKMVPCSIDSYITGHEQVDQVCSRLDGTMDLGPDSLPF